MGRPTVPRRAFLAALGSAATAAAMRPGIALAAPVVVISAPTNGTDATQTIKNQIAAAPNGAVIRFPVGRSQGRYRCDFPIVVEGRRDLTIEGPSPSDPAVFWTDLKVTKAAHPQVFIGDSSQRQHWKISNCTGMVLRNLRVQGPNTYRDAAGYTKIQPPYEAEHAFFVPGCDGVLIEDCSADSVLGDGVFLGAGSTHAGPKNITVRRFHVRSCGRTGIGLTRCSNILLDGVVTELTGTGAMSFEPNGPAEYVNGVEIRNCRMDSRQPLIPAHGVRPINDVWVHHNVFANSGNAKSWPIIVCEPLIADPAVRSKNWRVEDNRLEFAGTGGAFVFRETDNVVIRRNAMSKLGRFRAGVILERCGGTLTVTDNDFGACLSLQELSGSPTPAHWGNVWASGTMNDGGPPQAPPTTQAPNGGGGTPTTVGTGGGSTGGSGPSGTIGTQGGGAGSATATGSSTAAGSGAGTAPAGADSAGAPGGGSAGSAAAGEATPTTTGGASGAGLLGALPDVRSITSSGSGFAVPAVAVAVATLGLGIFARRRAVQASARSAERVAAIEVHEAVPEGVGSGFEGLDDPFGVAPTRSGLPVRVPSRSVHAARPVVEGRQVEGGLDAQRARETV